MSPVSMADLTEGTRVRHLPGGDRGMVMVGPDGRVWLETTRLTMTEVRPGGYIEPGDLEIITGGGGP